VKATADSKVTQPSAPANAAVSSDATSVGPGGAAKTEASKTDRPATRQPKRDSSSDKSARVKDQSSSDKKEPQTTPRAESAAVTTAEKKEPVRKQEKQEKQDKPAKAEARKTTAATKPAPIQAPRDSKGIYTLKSAAPAPDSAKPSGSKKETPPPTVGAGD